MSRYPKIIAVDFDGWLFTNAWPKIGEPNWDVINALKEEQKNGAKVILWTCRAGKPLSKAIQACERVGINLDSVNTNLVDMVIVFGSDTRKVFANEYWDDRAVRMPSLLTDDDPYLDPDGVRRPGISISNLA